mmetsp:Transcript_42442/g.76237  ORF Transcript_42442/g.76237 Transcript_42442/m.76237 type:complete len:453 (-) Transcript_42442:81-1439(-)|eukprot:CAMPEP_0197652174 /NCGR_PEP_ID=MMETSP1338-20131121/34285_1 /TAXON_ID=43686 ORGANISM="Pelagodinium beii, Strain RCC1491" /NCGR_SAMPLE_ID=MMETSP1338 /ASSEMBLY_ACC=CAM_ASM_000754 /LENGTH=452 /DNA_ID=CAMNT_0043226985 /DNA_START=73 /DNA_END=1431 /DNA_ORIENTATION=-
MPAYCKGSQRNVAAVVVLLLSHVVTVHGVKYLRHAAVGDQVDPADHDSLRDISSEVIALARMQGAAASKSALQIPSDTPEELHGIMSMVLKLAGNSSSSKADPEAIGSLKDNIRDMIDNKIKPRVESDFDQLQTQLQDYYTLFNACEDNRHAGMNQSEKHQLTIPIMVKEHKECRNVEASLYSKKKSRKDEQDATQLAKDASCKHYGDGQVPDYQICASASGESAEEYYKRMIEKFKKEAKVLKSGREACENATKALEEAKVGATDADNAWTKQRDACNLKQNALDEESCSLSTIMAETCDQYKTCRSQATLSLDLMSNTCKEKENALRKQWWTLNLINCMLDAIGSNPTKTLEDCQTADFSTGFRSLLFPNAPLCSACEKLVETPGNAAYEEAVFKSIPETAPPKPCTASCCLDTGVMDTATTTEEPAVYLNVAREIPPAVLLAMKTSSAL